MDRVSLPVFLVVFIAGLSSAAAARDYHWIPGWGSTTPSIYYAPPPIEYFDDSALKMKLAPSYASLSAPSYTSGPVGSYDFVPYLTSSLADNPDQWPEQYPSTTTVEEAFGSDAESVYGSVSLLDGVSAKGEDGYSQLLKEGVASLLNAVDKHFKFSEDDVKKCFSFKTSLSSEAAAAEQAHQFEDANLLYAASHT